MKKTWMSLSFVVALAALLMALPAQAVSYVEVVSFEAPFDFVVNDTTLPAGTYVVEAEDQTDPADMRIRTPDAEHVVEFVTKAMPDTWDVNEKMGPKAKVVFSEVGDEQYLTEVWMPAHSNARAVLTGEDLKDAERTEISAHEGMHEDHGKHGEKMHKKHEKHKDKKGSY